jgi:putative nucleotidyltransferase with HDIG domain
VKKESWPKLITHPVERLWRSFVESPFAQNLGDFSFVFVLVFLLLLMVTRTTRFQSLPTWHEGEVAAFNVRVPKTVEIIDRASTLREREKVINHVPVVLDFNPKSLMELNQLWRLAVRESRAIPDKKKNLRVLSFAQTLQNYVKLNESDLKWLLGVRFDSSLERSLLQSMAPFINMKIVEDIALLENGADVFNVETRKNTFIKSEEISKQFVTLDFVQSSIRDPDKLASRWLGMNFANRVLLAGLHARLIKANSSINLKETEAKRKIVVEKMRPLLKKLYRGEVVVREGETITKDTEELLTALRSRQDTDFQWLKLFWQSLLASFALGTFVVFLRRYSPDFLSRHKDILIAGVLLIVSLAFFKLTVIFQMEILADSFRSIPTPFFLFMIPVATSALIIRLLLTPYHSLIFSFLFSLGSAVLLDKAFLYGFYSLTVCLGGTVFLQSCKSRAELYRAGFATAFLAGICSVLLLLSWGGSLPADADIVKFINVWNASTLRNLFWGFCGGFLGGLFSSSFTLMITPLFESFLDYTTELKLIELSRMDNPLLRDLVLKAPGTYHHSIIVGTLAEAACEAIGANPLLARVGAYYHDIGKMVRPDYFVENQTSGYNPHDQTKPHLSAKIIISHVKEGVNLANRYGLGRAITEFIEQHHGRTLVGFFYNKALQMAAQPDSDMKPEEINEDDFRYPGPNPKSKEAVIMALADSCEAATRSLVDPTPARIEAMVVKIVSKALDEGLLEDAEITLQSLHLVSRAFVRILLSIHHQRIEYPDQEKSLPQTNASSKHLKSIK